MQCIFLRRAHKTKAERICIKRKLSSREQKSAENRRYRIDYIQKNLFPFVAPSFFSPYYRGSQSFFFQFFVRHLFNILFFFVKSKSKAYVFSAAVRAPAFCARILSAKNTFPCFLNNNKYILRSVSITAKGKKFLFAICHRFSAYRRILFLHIRFFADFCVHFYAAVMIPSERVISDNIFSINIPYPRVGSDTIT